MRTHRSAGALCPGWLLALPLLSISGLAYAVDPVFVPGNPTCANISAGSVGFSIPGPDTAGVHTNPVDGATITITNNGDPRNISWSAAIGSEPLGLDAIIVKAGNGANVYFYNPEATSGANLVTPSICGQNNNWCALSHLVICYDYEVYASKTAQTTYDRRFEWSIDKSATPSSLNFFVGDTGEVGYSVSVQKSAPIDFGFTVSGDVTVYNPWPVSATISNINDAMDGDFVALECGVSFPYALGAGSSLTCTYSTTVEDKSQRTNIATVIASGQVGGAEATADVIFGEPANVELDSVNVSDTNGMSWFFGNSGQVQYTRLFDCADVPGHDNTATITETGASDSAGVGIACYTLSVGKSATTGWRRTWNWDLAKAYISPALNADTNNDQIPDALLVASGQTVMLGYTVTANATSSGSDYEVSGIITVSNNNPVRQADLINVTDTLSGAGSLAVNCPSLVVPAGGSLVCTYSGFAPDASERTNVGQALQQNVHFAANGAGTAEGSTAYSGTAAVSFSANPSTETDECVSVSDGFNGQLPVTLGQACAGQLPRTFTFSGAFTYEVSMPLCTTFGVRNDAFGAANDSGRTAGADATVVITNRDCTSGCTLTPGYWKTHSNYGPAPYDPAWALVLPGGANTTFFLSGKSWYQTLWTAPAGNVYWTLSRAYIAAALNQHNGATVPTGVQAALDQASAIFAANTPAQIGTLKGNAPLRSTIINLAATLDMYNNGLNPDGPAHCTEDSTSGN
ncbi:hypothetical protein [Tahibacter amnicola]|uniref:Uncharacterized protein n=1 Tax=Tahibacter amnicola TaxID=2976241 RepID=A0ABY6B8M4_9GAMM|nr:hypothetical protein [Tahibacter amnicola]UXI66364.1 hypothetical protein N4264_16595 [Tahibacter amnicola]